MPFIFTNREGGFSAPPFDSANLGDHVGEVHDLERRIDRLGAREGAVAGMVHGHDRVGARRHRLAALFRDGDAVRYDHKACHAGRLRIRGAGRVEDLAAPASGHHYYVRTRGVPARSFVGRPATQA